MPEKTEDLWPAAIADETEIEVPATIAAEQARLLGEKTKNVITAKVTSIPAIEVGRMWFGFTLVAPSLSNYRLRLFEFSYRLDSVYPVRISDFVVKDLKTIDVQSEQEFKAALKMIFAHEGIVRIIQTLRAQSRDLGRDEIPF